MKRISIVLSLFGFASFVNASVNISGTAVGSSAPGLVDGADTIFLVKDDGSSFDSSVISSIVAGSAINSDSTYGGGYSVISEQSVENLFDTLYVDVITGNFDLSDPAASNPSQNDFFAIVQFATSTTTVVSGDSVSVWTDTGWKLPADGAAETFGGAFSTLSDGADFTGTVVPEPSAFALFSGLMGLACVATRRRR